MLQPVFDFIEKFATDFTWKRLVIAISFFTLFGIISFLYEAQTATSQLSKYERTVAIIENLESLKTDNCESKSVKENIYSGLTTITKPGSDPATLDTNISIELKQSLLASAPWVLFCLFYVPGYFRGDKNAPSTVGGTLTLALMLGAGGYFTPVEWSAWIRYGAYPIGLNILILYMLIWYGNRTKP